MNGSTKTSSKIDKKEAFKKYFSFSQLLIDSKNLRIHTAKTSALQNFHPPRPLES